MRNLLIAASAALFAAMPAQANELVRVYEQALTNDTQLRSAEHALAAAREARPQARGALLPTLGAQGTVGQSVQQNTFNPGGPQPEEDTETNSYGISLNLSVYDHANWMRLSQSRDRLQAAEATYRSAHQNLALRVTQAYFNVLAAKDTLRFATAENTAVERQLEQARKRFEVGLSAITDVHEAQARYDLTVSQKLDAEQQLRNTQDALIEITGGSAERLVSLQEEFPLSGATPDDGNQWIEAALNNNLDLVAARINTNIAKKDIGINRAGHYPTLDLAGTYGKRESGGFVSESESQDVTLTLTVPIYSGGVTQSRVRQASSTHQQRLAELEGTRRSVERQVRNAFQGVQTGVARVKALKQAVISNTTALDASETGLRVGARTAVDVLNAQRELFRAQRDYSRARYDYLISILSLKQAAGQLTARDLAEIDQLLVQ